VSGVQEGRIGRPHPGQSRSTGVLSEPTRVLIDGRQIDSVQPGDPRIVVADQGQILWNAQA